MSVKTEILDNLKVKLEDLGIFKKVVRGLIGLDKVKKTDYPLACLNSYKTERNDELSTYNRQARNMYVEVFCINKENMSGNFHKDLDDFEDSLISYFENLMPTDLHNRCVNFVFIESEEVINEQDFDGLFFMKFNVVISYYV